MQIRHEKLERDGIHPKFSFSWPEIYTKEPYSKLQNFSESERLEVLLEHIREVCLPYECSEEPDSVRRYGQNWTRFSEMKEFEFLEKLGEGSYGHVYKVKHQNGRIFALKLFDISFSPTKCPDQYDAVCIYEFCIGRKEAVFLLEATLESKTRHIPKFYDFGFCMLGGKARSYILLEYIDGYCLFGSSVTDQKGFEGLVTQAFDAVKDIHSLEYAHCDISPVNLMVTKEGTVKIIDFGTVSDEDDAPDYAMGSINPPENWSQRIPDLEKLFAVDVWCAAYSLLTVARGTPSRNLMPYQKTLVDALDDLRELIQAAERNVALPLVLYEALSLNFEERPKF
ncbi:putative serine/threonine protein kinase [Brazilian marseillevirus]|uniref:putative serine/threonine protein kinase n=1 Tax=Brazilian marseillevirus TaxID=1813599 RepID=UPI0007863D13|nr:putative serine/threonine protein kinase [Brazilian marseillevirus]AMQ10608.1 putative serine/threonine protein kinase [Brazilian marseillevirus]